GGGVDPVAGAGADDAQPGRFAGGGGQQPQFGGGSQVVEGGGVAGVPVAPLGGAFEDEPAEQGVEDVGVAQGLGVPGGAALGAVGQLGVHVAAGRGVGDVVGVASGGVSGRGASQISPAGAESLRTREGR